MVALGLDGLANARRQPAIGIHVEQDRPGVTDQPVGPAHDDDCTDQAGNGVHPEPSKNLGKEQADNLQDGNGGIGDDVDDGGPHIVVAAMVAVVVLFEREVIGGGPDHDLGSEGMRLGDLVPAFPIAVASGHCERLPAAVRADRFDLRIEVADGRRRQAPQSEAWRYTIFEDRDRDLPAWLVDTLRLFAMIFTFSIVVTVPCPCPCP